MKNHARLLRLGSFETLESRALLAHVGPPGMFEDRHPASSYRTDFNTAEYSSPARPASPFREMQGHEITGRRDDRDFAPNHANGSQRERNVVNFDNTAAYSPVITNSSWTTPQPTTTIVVFITISPPETSLPRVSPQATSPSSTSSASNRQAASLVAPPSNVPSFGSTPTLPRGSSGGAGTDPLTLTSSLLLRRTDQELLSADDEGTSESANDDQNEPTDDQHRAAAPPACETTVQTTTAENDEADLIELTEEDPLTYGKRKLRKGSAVVREVAPKNLNLRQTRQLAGVEVRNFETWRDGPATSQELAAAEDDLIELLAVDQLVSPRPASETRHFEAEPPQLQATLGYFQAVELDPETIPTVDSAAVAAAALPAAAAK